MFRQVNVDISERKFEYILCSDFTVEQLRASQLQKVTFGSASAPYLAVRSLPNESDLHLVEVPPMGCSC